MLSELRSATKVTPFGIFKWNFIWKMVGNRWPSLGTLCERALKRF